MEADNKPKLHSLGLNGIFEMYTFKDFAKSNPMIISLIISYSLIIICINLNTEIEVIFNSILNITLTFLPNIIGFGLGGYAIMISFSNQIMLDKMFKRQLKFNKPTLYQRTSAIFAFVLILQIFTLTISVVVNLLKDFSFNANEFIDITLYIVSFILIFLTLWSILVMIDLIKNIFNIGQAFHISLLNDFKDRQRAKRVKRRRRRSYLT